MWQGASELKIAATRGYGATLDLESANPMEAFERLAALQAETGRVFVDPHSDPLVIAGHGTAGLEIEEDAPDFDAVVVGVGGGGLVSGLVAALPGRRVIAVEPELAQSLHAGIAAGARVAAQANSIADGCNSPFAGELAIEMTRDLELVLVTEEEIEHAFRILYQRAKLACEPAGAVATAAWLAGKIEAEEPGADGLGRQRRQPKPPLLSWPGDEGRNSPRVRPRDGALRLREHVHDAFHEARAARRGLLRLPPVLHRQAEARRHGRTRRALPAAARKGRARRARLVV